MFFYYRSYFISFAKVRQQDNYAAVLRQYQDAALLTLMHLHFLLSKYNWHLTVLNSSAVARPMPCVLPQMTAYLPSSERFM
jgi:hypothetical protein